MGWTLTQGSARSATLGWRMKRRWRFPGPKQNPESRMKKVDGNFFDQMKFAE